MFMAGCASAHGGFGNDTDSGSDPANDAGFATNKDGGVVPSGDADTTTGPAVIYAHTDTELYMLDPTTQAITDIGAFAAG